VGLRTASVRFLMADDPPAPIGCGFRQFDFLRRTRRLQAVLDTTRGSIYLISSWFVQWVARHVVFTDLDVA